MNRQALKRDIANGVPCFMAYDLKRPGCMAHGSTVTNAHRSLSGARKEYKKSVHADELFNDIMQGFAELEEHAQGRGNIRITEVVK